MDSRNYFIESKRRLVYRCLLIIATVAGLGCSSGQLLNSLSGASNYLAYSDVNYGEHPRQRMDIYTPNGSEQADEEHACKVIFVHGGSWQSGDKHTYGFVGAAFAELGYFVAVPNYRLHPEVAFPDFVRDIGSVLSHPLLEKKRATDKIAVIGHSAGAFNAAHLSYDKTYLREKGLDTNTVDLFISLAGPHDYFLPSDKPRWRAIFGQSATQQQSALSVNYVSDDSPPTLVLHGEDDGVVTPRSAHSLAEKLAANNIQYELRIYENIGHIKIIAALAPRLQSLAPTLEDIHKFLAMNGCRAG